MIPPVPYEHRFRLDDDDYLLVGWSRAADRRIRADYALGIAAAPAVLDTIDGADLYAECVARECLKEAPECFWETRPPLASDNGTPRRVFSVEQVPLDLWERFRTEVNAFVAHFRPVSAPTTVVAPAASAGEPDALAVAETVPPRLRGRAE
jgi:hypothetical protein